MKTSRSAAAKRKRPATKSAVSRSRVKPKSKTKTRRTKTAATRKKTTTKRSTAKKRTPKKATAKKKTTAKKKLPVRKKLATREAPPAKSTVAKAPRRASTKTAKSVPIPPLVPANELKIGLVTHYYSHLNVAVVAVTARGMQVGDRIHLKGYTTDFYQTIASMEVEHQPVMRAEPGQTVGLKVNDHARDHDGVYVVT